jgi:hypothetical protein
VHRVLRVEAVRLDELRAVDVALPACAEKPLALTLEVTEIAAAGALGEDRSRETAQLTAEVGLDQRQLWRHKQQQQDGRVSLEREP